MPGAAAVAAGKAEWAVPIRLQPLDAAAEEAEMAASANQIHPPEPHGYLPKER
jgi:hypothetical protein